MTEATLPWILLFGAIIIGAGGGWAFLIWVTIASVKYRQEQRNG